MAVFVFCFFCFLILLVAFSYQQKEVFLSFYICKVNMKVKAEYFSLKLSNVCTLRLEHL